MINTPIFAYIAESGSFVCDMHHFKGAFAALQMRAVGRSLCREWRIGDYGRRRQRLSQDPRRNSIKNFVVIILASAAPDTHKWRLFVRRSVSKIKKSVGAILFASGFRQAGRKLPAWEKLVRAQVGVLKSCLFLGVRFLEYKPTAGRLECQQKESGGLQLRWSLSFVPRVLRYRHTNNNNRRRI